MYGAERMNFSKSACWLFSGLMLVASDVNAQEVGQQILQNTEPEVRLPAGIDEYEKLLLDAEALMKAGMPEDAYKLLEPLEFDRAGEIRFDYLIGIAALDSGKPDKATLAFERVLAEDPGYVGARLELARAYFQLGDLSRARTEFEIVLNQNPSEVVRATIRKYLEKIEEKESGKQTHFSGYAEITIGRDTNVNNASELSDNIVTPTTNPDELADNYFAMAAGAQVRHSLNANWLLYAGADLSQHNNYKQKNYDLLNLEERFGVIHGTRYDRYRIGMLGGQNTMGNSHYRNNVGINAEWRHAVGANNQLNVFGQYRQYRFADEAMKLNDIDQQIAGAGWLHVFGNGKSTLSGSLYFGMENDVGPATLANPEGGRTDGVKRLAGFRFGGQTTGENVKLYFSAGEQFGKFEETNPTILSQRSDRLDDVTLGANWYLDRQWTANMQMTRFINMSNVDAYAFDRTDYFLTIRRNFN